MKLRNVVLAVALLMGLEHADAQTKPASLDKSPMDMCYFPADYPVLKIQDKAPGPLIARAIYSRPQKNGRHLFGDLVEYGKVWRLGANEATEIEFFQDVRIDNKKVKKGRYTIYALVDTDKWTIILNKETDTWGAFRYDMAKDVLRTTVAVERQPEVAEAFSMEFEKAKKGAQLIINWDDVLVKLPFSW